MSIVFYTAPMSSASPVAAALAELEVPHERVVFDLSRRDHKSAQYLAINPNGLVPTLVVDGTPMFEGLAILLWLGETYGPAKALWPSVGDADRLRAFAWCTWAYVSYGSRVAQLVHHAAQADAARGQLGALLDILERHLERQPFMLGERYSLVDLVVASTVGYSVMVGVELEGRPRVQGWLSSFQARPAFRAMLEQAA